MPLAAPVTMATLSLRRMGRVPAAEGDEGSTEVVVHDLAEAEREIADHVNRGDHLEHRQLRHRRQRVWPQLERGRAGPGALHRHVLALRFDQLADPRAPADRWTAPHKA